MIDVRGRNHVYSCEKQKLTYLDNGELMSAEQTHFILSSNQLKFWPKMYSFLQSILFKIHCYSVELINKTTTYSDHKGPQSTRVDKHSRI